MWNLFSLQMWKLPEVSVIMNPSQVLPTTAVMQNPAQNTSATFSFLYFSKFWTPPTFPNSKLSWFKPSW